MNKQLSCGHSAEKPYPRRCAACGEIAVSKQFIQYDAEVRHDGKLYSFPITNVRIDQCQKCREQYFTNATSEQINLELRRYLGLLLPEEIRSGLEQLGLTQLAFSKQLGVAAETVSRWLSGSVIQTKSLDKFMRLYFSLPSVRAALSAPEMPSSTKSVAGAGQNDQL
jgi:DNA-binding transcriptional regulator YiaG